MSIKEKFDLKKSKKRTGAVGVLILAFVVGVVLRLFWLQIVKGQELARDAKEQIAGENTELSPRGSILDRNGEDLAVSIISKSLYVNPQAMDDDPDRWERGKQPQRNPRRVAANLLAPILGLNAEDLFQEFNYKDRCFIWVKRTLDPKVSAEVIKVLKENKLSGFHFQDESKRYYTKNDLAAQVLGFVGTDDKGLEGIEASLDKLIKGKETKQGNFFDARGNLIGESGMNSVQGPKMNSVYLTLDSNMQFILEKSLDEAMAKTHSASAAAIIMNPHTGEILGMASRPTFDPNNFSQAASNAFLNRGVAIIYEPGSVFKPIIGCAGLMEHLITPTTHFHDEGTLDVGGRLIKNWDDKGLGDITYTDVIKFSVNTGMAHLGLMLGGKKETEYAEKFGFGSTTGSDVPGEEAGILYNPEDMVPSDVATMAIGQGIAVSPLQMLNAICAIANGGELLKPFIVKKVVSPSGKLIIEGHKQVVRRVVTEEVAAQMRTMMEKEVSEGGGKTAQIKGYKIAGKTGTAEKLAVGGGYAAGVYIASFVGFVPADNPDYAMLVVLDSPQGAFYGSQVAAPIFRDILQQILVAEGIQPSDSSGLPSVESIMVQPQGTNDLPQMTILDSGRVKIPNFAGLNMRQVAELIQQGRLALIPHGGGEAFKQNPAPGTILKNDDTVDVWFK
ncbi:MAG: penicillin-binding transpeptidase domain-containing protein [Acidaminococcaceae bacterium]|nr:penicillin-binding transpeptidase domain-containing protein [Acidaminococcaceae bacterium]MDD4722175.1 penicillin-binding transpeptidase domain-containing protein [Acidaminococcaceae bacterium]